MAASATGRDVRILMVGKSENEKTVIGIIIMGRNSNSEATCIHGQWRNRSLTLVKTTDLFSLPQDRWKQEMETCAANCHPGPNVLLLVVNPSDFTEGDRRKMTSILSLFGKDALKCSIVIMTQNDKRVNPSVKKLIQDYGQKQHTVNLEERNLPGNDLYELMIKIETVATNMRKPLMVTEETNPIVVSQAPKTLNLVLCGIHDEWKTSVSKTIRTQKTFHFSKKVANKADVFILELPALCGKSKSTAMKESFDCISLCEPEGVHAFILIVPFHDCTDKDNKELETIQKTLKYRANEFIIIVFIVEKNPDLSEVAMVLEKDASIKWLCQSSNQRFVLMNMKDKQQVSELLRTVETMATRGSFTNDMLKARSQKENTIKRNEKTKQRKQNNLTEKSEKCDGNRKEAILRKEMEKRLDTDRKQVIQAREKMRKEKDDWEEEKREWWQKQHQEYEQRWQEEKRRLRTLRDEYEQELERQRGRKLEQNEEEWKEALRNKLEEIQKEHKEEITKKTEKCDDFNRSYTNDFSTDIKRYRMEVEYMKQRQCEKSNSIIRQLSRKKKIERDFHKLQAKQREEMRSLKSTCPTNNKQLSHLEQAHEKEINEWIQTHVDIATQNNICSIL
ncbi:GTPase IMAP family member 8-like isoform 1-T2 [Pholidichthys leucotaenia]